MLADVSVHEPQQPVDTESAMAFTMEGNQQQAPASLRAYTWSPGWNSNQSIHKFQSEVSGPDRTEVPGIHLFTGTADLPSYAIDAPAASSLVAQHHIFGSDPVSNHAAELATLIPGPYARMNRTMAESLGVEHGGGLGCETESAEVQLTVLIDEGVADGCVVYPYIGQTIGLGEARISDLKPVANYQSPRDPLRPNLITTDGMN